MKVGDRVVTPDGHTGIIEKVDRHWWRGRDEKPDRLWHYYIPSPRPGSPIVWWYGWQLILIKGKQSS